VTPNLAVVIPTSLKAILNDEVVRRAGSSDSVVVAALSQYFHTARHRAYQVSTSAALVQGVHEGAISSKVLLANGDFGLLEIAAVHEVCRNASFSTDWS
jgi:acetolactate decarboxylase